MNKALFFILSSLFPLLLAYFIEMNYSVSPCILCIYQRIVFFIIIILSIMLYKIKHKALIVSIFLAFIINITIAVYHIGIENNIFSSKCAVNNTADDIANAYSQLLNTNLSSCADKFIIFNLSIPTWNVLYCVGVLCIYLVLGVFKNGIFWKK